MDNNRSIKTPPERRGSRVETVDCLRGIAVSMVVLMHLFVGANSGLKGGRVIEPIFRYGWLGVDVFFVISGFIIPYSLYNSGYRIGQFGRFLLKRIVRLDPPYILSLLWIVVVGLLLSRFSGPSATPFEISWIQVGLHLAYLNALFDRPWLNPVFWTLGVEFQYYLIAGLLFPLFSSRSRPIFLATAAGLGLLAFSFPQERFVSAHLFVFLLGIQMFRLKCELCGRNEALILLAVLGLGALVTLGPAVTVTAVGTALAIGWIQIRSRLLVFLGGISYSLYLLHVPIGVKLVNLGSRWVSGDMQRVLMVCFAALISVATAAAFFRVVERPAQDWSSRIRFRPNVPMPVVAP